MQSQYIHKYVLLIQSIQKSISNRHSLALQSIHIKSIYTLMKSTMGKFLLILILTQTLNTQVTILALTYSNTAPFYEMTLIDIGNA